jgi:hypothetical protein
LYAKRVIIFYIIKVYKCKKKFGIPPEKKRKIIYQANINSIVLHINHFNHGTAKVTVQLRTLHLLQSTALMV